MPKPNKEAADPSKANAATAASANPAKESAPAADGAAKTTTPPPAKESAPGMGEGMGTEAKTAVAGKEGDVKPADGSAAAGKDPSKLAPESAGAPAEGAKPAAVAEGAKPAAVADSGANAANSADEQKDSDLLKQTIGQYLSPDEMSSDDVMELAKEIYAAFNQMGYPIDKAMQAVGYVLKYAQYLSSQKPEDNSGGNPDANKPPAAAQEAKPAGHEQNSAPAPGDAPPHAAPAAGDGAAKHAEGKPDASGDPKAAQATEGATPAAKETPAATATSPAKETPPNKEATATVPTKESESIELKAENAALKERLAAVDAKEHLESLMRTTGLPEQVKKNCRESLGDVRTKKYVDDNYKKFVEAYKSGLSVGSETGALPFVVSSEKKSNNSKKAMNFADCVK